MPGPARSGRSVDIHAVADTPHYRFDLAVLIDVRHRAHAVAGSFGGALAEVRHQSNDRRFRNRSRVARASAATRGEHTRANLRHRQGNRADGNGPCFGELLAAVALIMNRVNVGRRRDPGVGRQLHQEVAINHRNGFALLHDGSDVGRIEGAPLDGQAAVKARAIRLEQSVLNCCEPGLGESQPA